MLELEVIEENCDGERCRNDPSQEQALGAGPNPEHEEFAWPDEKSLKGGEAANHCRCYGTGKRPPCQVYPSSRRRTIASDAKTRYHESWKPQMALWP